MQHITAFKNTAEQNLKLIIAHHHIEKHTFQHNIKEEITNQHNTTDVLKYVVSYLSTMQKSTNEGAAQSTVKKVKAC